MKPSSCVNKSTSWIAGDHRGAFTIAGVLPRKGQLDTCHPNRCESKPSILGSQNPCKSYQSFQNCLEIHVSINLLVIFVGCV